MFRFVATCLAAVMALSLAAAPASAADPAKKKKKAAVAVTGTVVGTIKNVSDDGKTLTIDGLGGKKKAPAPTTEVKVTPSTKVEYTGIDAKEDQKLQVGYAVTVVLNGKDQTTADSIKVSKATVEPKKKKKQ